jgi:hypothetical protein
MRRAIFGASRIVIGLTVALVFVVAFLPGRAGIAARIYAILLAAIALAYALRSLRDAYPPVSPLRSRARRTDTRSRPPASLGQLENLTALGVASAFDLHHRLRPRLRGIAAGLLATHRHTALDRDPERARDILGATTWDLVRPDRPPPSDRLARGLPLSDMRAVVASLERV